MHKAHETIWLQVDPGGESFDHEQWSLEDGATWCKDQISANDVKYVRADIAEAELEAARAEIEHLQAESDPEALHIAYLHGQADRNQKLAAEQANNVRLREALHYSLGAWEYDGISDEHGSIFQEACSRCDAPSDTSALEAIVKKAGEVMREKCAQSADDNCHFATYDIIQLLPPVTLDDLN